MRLYIVRHGETIGTVVKKYHGHTDVPLDKKGITQVKKLARELKNVKFDAAYSSDLIRCSCTARMILGGRKMKLECLRGLREINFGRWEGKTFDEMQTEDYCLFDKWLHDLPNFNMPGGEAVIGMAERINGEMKKIIKRHPKGNVLLVSHGGPIRVILCEALDISIQKFWNMSIDTASLSVVEYEDGCRIVKLMNKTA